MRAVAKILRAPASEYSSNFCEQSEQRPNFQCEHFQIEWDRYPLLSSFVCHRSQHRGLCVLVRSLTDYMVEAKTLQSMFRCNATSVAIWLSYSNKCLRHLQFKEFLCSLFNLSKAHLYRLKLRLKEKEFSFG